MKKTVVTSIVLALGMTLLAGCGGSQTEGNGGETPESEAKFPNKPIEFVVPYSAGGGSDVNARTVAEIVQKHGFIDQPMMVQNREGGSGAVGNAYTYGKSGDDHTLMVWNTGQMLSSRVNEAEVTIDKLTPIAVLAYDESFIAVQAGKFESLEEYLAAAEASPGEITFGGVSMGSEDHMVWGMMSKATGLDISYVAFSSGGECMSALLGGHIDATVFQVSEMYSQLEAGGVTPIAYLGEDRLPGELDYVPSFTELGYPDVRLQMFRGYVGPPDMPEEAVKFYSDLFKDVFETQEWKEDYCGKFMLTPVFMDYTEAGDFIKSEETKYLSVLRDTGILE